MNAASEFAVPAGLGALERALEDDFNGDHSRALIDTLAVAAREAALKIDHADGPTADAARRRLEGFEAGQRIVRHLWQRLHGSVLKSIHG
jgi:predicted trehalose synthase